MISVHVDPSAALARLSALEQKQAPYAMSRALNRLANEAQKAEREGMKSRFKLRRVDWNLRGIYISKEDRATKTTWRVVIQVSAKTDYLDKFEKGGEKLPVGNHNYLWEPNQKVFGNRILQSSDPLRPKNLHLHKDPHGRIIGDARTFIVPTHNTQVPLVVVQRRDRSLTKGSQRKLDKLTLDNVTRKSKRLSRIGGTVTLYKLRRRVPIKAKLEFVSTVQKVVHSRFQPVFEEALADAMRTAK